MIHLSLEGLQRTANLKTNRRLNMLTILSVIFNPATRLTAIWGMNFVTIPELNCAAAPPLKTTCFEGSTDCRFAG